MNSYVSINSWCTRTMLRINKKKSFSLLPAVIILLSALLTQTFGAVQTSTVIPFSGSVTYQPTPIPNTTSTLTGFGSDYCVFYDSGNPERWLNYVSQMQKWKSLGFTTYRLGFVFENSPVEPRGSHGSSVYTSEKLNKVLEIFDTIGLRVIMMLQNNYDCQYYIGSSGWRTSWLDLVRTFKGDTRLAAVALFSEPQNNQNTNTPWAAYSTWSPKITTRFQLQEEFTSLIKEIHEIDPNRIVIYPYPAFQYDNYDDWFTDLQLTGILNEPNVVFDVTHPYFMENEWDMGMTPTQKAAWYANKHILPSVDFFGSDKVWCGETFAWVGDTVADVPATEALQTEWITAIVNQFSSYNMSFNIWDTIPGSTGGRWARTEPAIYASNYL